MNISVKIKNLDEKNERYDLSLKTYKESITGTFNSFISMTNGSAVTFAWQAVANSSNPTARVRATNAVSFSFRVCVLNRFHFSSKIYSF